MRHHRPIQPATIHRHSFAAPLGAACLLAVLLAGCQIATAPVKPATEDLVAEAESATVIAEEMPAAAGATAEALPWPPPGGTPPTPQEAAAPRKLYEWQGDGRRLTRIVIDTNQQKARFYAGDEQVGWSTVATGMASHPTPSGEFEIIERVADKRSNLYGRIYNRAGRVVKTNARVGRDPIPPGGRFEGASMPNFLRLTYDGIGLHAGPIPRPGSPASHGCIRLPDKVSEAVFRHVRNGTPVTVVGSGPSYGNYAERLRQRRQQERERRAAEEAAELAAGQAREEAEMRALAALDEAPVTRPSARPAARPTTPVAVPATPPAATTFDLEPAGADPHAAASGDADADEAPASTTVAAPEEPTAISEITAPAAAVSVAAETMVATPAPGETAAESGAPDTQRQRPERPQPSPAESAAGDAREAATEREGSDV